MVYKPITKKDEKGDLLEYSHNI